MRTMVIILEQVCAEWLDMKRLSVRESTFARYQMIIQKHVLPEFGKYPLEEISSSVVNSYTCRKLEEISTKTVRDICTILKSVLRYAEKEYGLHDIAGNMVLPKQQRTRQGYPDTQRTAKAGNVFMGTPAEATLCRHPDLSLYGASSGGNMWTSMERYRQKETCSVY